MSIIPKSNSFEALEWLSHGKDIGLKENNFFRYGWQDKVRVFFGIKNEKEEVKKIVNFIKENLKIASNDSKLEWLKLSDAVIQKYANNRNVATIITLFEREI